ncbi:ABC transporter permease [Streptomyces sp. NBC_00190]|uniref:ABC transporter permease n=1 Tax=unclassified Streptomyces TaxID=2593676 RepID=UPI002E2C2A31|nr:ABC transporter permease [Streptomyces sp. NBC_00190]WSZ42931.1 ABC transporter permease [Streptomyces sp. NBC_00868]
MTTPTRAARRRIGPLEAVGNALSLASRNVTKLRKNPDALVDVTLQPLLMLFMFTFLFSGAIAGGDRDGYLQQLVPGLLVFSPLFVTIGTGVALCTDISKGFFDRLRSLPIARSAPLAGIVIGDVARYFLSVAVVLGVGTLMGFRIQTNPLAVLLAVVLMIAFGLSVCWMAILAGILVRTPAAVPGVLIGAVMPLSFGSNVFAPAETMPGWLQVWVNINPVTLMTDVNRSLLLGEGSLTGPLLGGLAWMAGFVVVFFPLSMRAYRRRLGR